ncbi:hypothetical protein B0T21DRAFT_324011 [Apiosordaria backusii]|uniref:Uncharacterized protein n=1 Tax=Apiosordaria backusii TaxID=314023 RepID=A0AA40K736_9PEZI|nr:hypothetical protein B0T21DRAFT_324011 [Apiosordaria backusii]
MELNKLPSSSTSSSNDNIIVENMEGPMYPTYPQDAFAYGQWTDGPSFPPTYPASNLDAQFDGMWGGAHPMTTYDLPTMFQTPDDVAWPIQEQGPTGSFSQSSTTTSSALYQGQDVEWNSIPPQDHGFPSVAWASNDQLQPAPSPLSEAPSYGNYTFNHRTPSDYEPQAAPFTQQRGAYPARESASPAASLPAPKSKTKGKGKTIALKPPKRTTESSSKPRASSGTKRKSPAPSTKSSGSASGDSSKPPPFLGIFPPDVDPREASAKMQREAWERCKTEAIVMSQRRLLLLDHERGALERETQKLQDNLALMREAAAREHGELKEAVRRAERLDARGYY